MENDKISLCRSQQGRRGPKQSLLSDIVVHYAWCNWHPNKCEKDNHFSTYIGTHATWDQSPGYHWHLYLSFARDDCPLLYLARCTLDSRSSVIASVRPKSLHRDPLTTHDLSDILYWEYLTLSLATMSEFCFITRIASKRWGRYPHLLSMGSMASSSPPTLTSS